MSSTILLDVADGVATLMSAMQRGQARFGMISMCIGTGMGAAGVFERV